MEDNATLGAGTGMASMAIHLLTFTLLLKRGLVTPGQVRELLDGAVLQFEQLQGLPEARIARAALYAQEQVRSLLVALETTSPEMKADRNPP